MCGQVLAALERKAERTTPGSPEKVRASAQSRREEEFKLLETLLWEGNNSYLMLNEHLARMARSAHFFRFKPIDRASIVRSLGESESQWRSENKREEGVAMKVRLLADEGGQVEIQSTPFTVEERNRKRFALAISPFPVHSDDTFLYHKTTNRKVYNEAWAQKVLNTTPSPTLNTTGTTNSPLHIG